MIEKRRVVVNVVVAADGSILLVAHVLAPEPVAVPRETVRIALLAASASILVAEKDIAAKKNV